MPSARRRGAPPPPWPPSTAPLTQAPSTMTIQVGETIPSGEFGYIPYAPELEDPAVCGLPSKITTEKDFKGKKVVLFGVPGAFTKTCSEAHLPPYVADFDKFKSKHVDAIYCVSSNDLFVMSAWGRVMKAGDKVVCISDPELAWLKQVGLTQDLSRVGFGERSARFAMVVDDLKGSLPPALPSSVTYIGVESSPGVGPSGAEAVLAKL
ncbi:hypothetical protein JCM21900_003386 [Sporobolomyces salmonicolor]